MNGFHVGRAIVASKGKVMMFPAESLNLPLLRRFASDDSYKSTVTMVIGD